MNSKKLYIFNLLVKILPSSRCCGLKARLLRWCGAKVGDNVQMFSPKIMGDFELEIGNNVWIGHEALIFGASGSKITIEKNAKVASRAILVTGYHDYNIRYDNIAGPGKCGDIIIGEGSLIDTQAIVVAHRTIGKKSHVAAGAVVTHDVPPMVRVAGVPARVIKDFREQNDK